MPTKTKPARLWLRRRTDGRDTAWVILDGGRQIATGCGPEDRAGAEAALQRYLDRKARPVKGTDADRAFIASAIKLYAEEVAPKQKRPEEAAGRLDRLLDWWGTKTVAEVTKGSCAAYVATRTSPAARRELEDLRAALNYFHAEGYVTAVPVVHLPEKGPPRERWLTRDELARLVWAAWRARESQRGNMTSRWVGRHAARFMLVAYYTGSRAGAVCAAGRSQFDLDEGIFYRRPEGEGETKKRRPPVALNYRIAAHIRRWFEKGIARRHVVEWRGKPVLRIKKSFAAAAKEAKLPGVTPHVLRHTAATHLMQLGVSLEDASSFLGMTVETLKRHYWHHHPDYQRTAANALASGQRLGNASRARNANLP